MIMMPEVTFHNINFDPLSEFQHEKHEIVLKKENDTFLLKKESEEQEKPKEKPSLEDLQKALIKPKEMKRLLYLSIPFTRHLVTELDNPPKGFFIDRQG